MRNFRYFALFFLLGFLLYGWTIHAPFYLDDETQIVRNAQIRDVRNIPSFFIESNLFQKTNTSIFGYHYKPLFFSSYALLYALGNGSSIPFHIFQLLLYILNVYLIFLFFYRLGYTKYAFFLSVIFLVHPANVEVVVYIAALQDLLFFFFGMLVMNFVASKYIHNRLFTFCIPVLLLCSLLSKETGVLFMVVVLYYVYLFERNLFTYYFKLVSAAGVLYVILRTIAGYHPVSFMTQGGVHEVARFPVLLFPKIFSYFWQEIFVPTLYLPTVDSLQNTANIQNIYAVIGSLCILGILSGLIIWIRRYFRRVHTLFCLFCVWALFGIGFHSQIIPLDVPVATRWISFPLVGVLGMTGVIAVVFERKTSRYRRLALFLYVFYIGALIIATEKTNMVWMSNMQLVR